MNPNDMQAILNQALQQQQHAQYGLLAINIGGFLVVAFVIYMFYARLRGIEDELMKFRIAYEFAHAPKAQPAPWHEARGDSSPPAAPRTLVPSAGDAKYMPKA